MYNKSQITSNKTHCRRLFNDLNIGHKLH